jgi:hypothetical protein
MRPGGILVFSEITPLPAIEQYTYEMLQARFALGEIATDGQGLRAVRLTAPA